MASGLYPLYFRLRNAINGIQAGETPEGVLEREVRDFLLNTPLDENFISDVQRNTIYNEIDPNFDDFDNFLSRLRHYIDNEFAAGTFPVDVVNTNINQQGIKDFYRNKVNAAREAFMLRYHTGRYEIQLKSLDAENKLIDQRITSFLSAQAILFAALAIVSNPSAVATIRSALTTYIPRIGIASSGFTLIVNAISFYSSSTLEKKIPPTIRDIVGLFLTVYERRTANPIEKFFRFLAKITLPPISIPLIFLISWFHVMQQLAGG